MRISDWSSDVCSSDLTYERVKSLKNNGVIKKYVAIVDREKVGYELVAYCNVTIKNKSVEILRDFEEKLNKCPEIVEVVSVSGVYDYMIKIVTKNIKEYNDFVEKTFTNYPHIGDYHSSIVLCTVKEETKIFL